MIYCSHLFLAAAGRNDTPNPVVTAHMTEQLPLKRKAEAADHDRPRKRPAVIAAPPAGRKPATRSSTRLKRGKAAAVETEGKNSASPSPTTNVTTNVAPRSSAQGRDEQSASEVEPDRSCKTFDTSQAPPKATQAQKMALKHLLNNDDHDVVGSNWGPKPATRCKFHVRFSASQPSKTVDQ